MKKQKAAVKSAASKPALCPQHHLPLEVSALDMDVFGKAFHVLVGHCPKCRDQYISQAVIPASRVFSVGGKRYQLLPELNNTLQNRKTPVQSPSTVSMQTKATETAEQNGVKRVAEKAHQKQIQKKHRKQATAAEKKKRDEQEKEKRKEQDIKETRKRIQGNKYGHFHARGYIGNCSKTDKCPNDHEPLIYVERVKISLDDMPFFTKGYCCLRCDRLIIPEPKLMRKAPNPTPKPAPEIVQSKPAEVAQVYGNPKPRELKREASFDNEGSTLFICKGTIACHRKGHEIESVTGVLENLKGLPVRININYCHNCKQYFIDYPEYKHYQKLYGTILGNFKVTSGSTFTAFSFETMAEESILRLCGYTVDQTDDMSVKQRHTILAYLMEHRIVDKADIISHLSFYIKTNGKRQNMGVAVSRWNDDIQWTRNYRIGEQRQVLINGIKKQQ